MVSAVGSTDPRHMHFVLSWYPSLLNHDGTRPVFPFPPGGVPSFTASSQIAGTPFQRFPTMPVAPQQQGLGSNVRCVHYDRTGVCYFGELCTFDHSPVPEENALEVQRQKDKEDSDRAASLTQLLASRNEELNALRLRIAEMSRAKGIRAIERAGYGDSNPFLTHDLVALHSEAQRYYRRHGLNGMGTGGVGGFRRDVGKATRSSVVRLDNRPKRIIVAPIEAGSDEDATLRQYLQV